jgi:DNA-binding transcriptional ArsR family regulator
MDQYFVLDLVDQLVRRHVILIKVPSFGISARIEHCWSRKVGLTIHTSMAIGQHIANEVLIDVSTAPDILLKTLADPTRRAIFERLCRDGKTTVVGLTAQAGVSQPVVSKHLRILKQAGLVDGRHVGRETHYSAHPNALAPLIDWSNQMTVFWAAKFDALEDVLDRMDQ